MKANDYIKALRTRLKVASTRAETAEKIADALAIELEWALDVLGGTGVANDAAERVLGEWRVWKGQMFRDGDEATGLIVTGDGEIFSLRPGGPDKVTIRFAEEVNHEAAK